ncbi:MAG: GTPase, partial [Chloroflexi bacterium]|nr:GTPase [Chloroflexota bacterium]
MQSPQRVIIAGAAGRDFHDFNTAFRDNDQVRVMAFTATQIPNIEGRRYPAELAGRFYPGGIPIYPEADLSQLIREHQIDQVIFSYSDVSHEYVMHLASQVLAAGADFRLLGPRRTMLKAGKPVVSIGAVRTGSGKSQTSRRVVRLLKELGYEKVVAVRHPMPYGNLAVQAVQRFASYEDMDRHDCTIEEREEYEPYVVMGAVIYAGVDYPAILKQVEEEAEIIVWDGGNNDLPFFQSDLHIVVADPHRPGHELRYHPGETNLRLADVVVINKVD